MTIIKGMNHIGTSLFNHSDYLVNPAFSPGNIRVIYNKQLLYTFYYIVLQSIKITRAFLINFYFIQALFMPVFEVLYYVQQLLSLLYLCHPASLQFVQDLIDISCKLTYSKLQYSVDMKKYHFLCQFNFFQTIIYRF